MLLSTGAFFKDWELPPAIQRVQSKLDKVPNRDRLMVQIMSMIPTDCLNAVKTACAEAQNEELPEASVAINILARHRESAPPLTIDTPDALRLTCNHGKITGAGCDEPAEALRHEGRLR